MKTRLLLGLVSLVGVAVLPKLRDFLRGFDRSRQLAFEELPLGIGLDEATRLLGASPVRQATECCLPERRGVEREVTRASKSDATRFYLFANGSGWCYCLGFDDENRLVVTTQGRA